MTLIEIPPGYRATLVAVSEQDAAVISALDKLWAKIREQDERIPASMIFDLTPGRSSSCTSVGFDQPWPVIEINLKDPDGHTISAKDALAFLLHQASHAIAGPQMTSEGRYHPRSFADAGVSLGLDVEASDPVTKAGDGWSLTSLARGALTRYRPEVDVLDRALRKWTPTEQPKAKRADSRNGVVLACLCVPPRKIRLRGDPAKIDVTRIKCEICGVNFEAR